jgi:hypothetical protein
VKVDHLDVVLEVARQEPPAKTLEGALAFTLKVLAVLTHHYPEERAGLLVKVAGESILTHTDGVSYSVNRICYPDQQLYKILTDTPATNAPEWEDNGVAQVGGYVHGYAALTPPLPVVLPGPLPPPVVIVVETDADRLAALEAAVAQLARRPFPRYRGTITIFGQTYTAVFTPIE